MECKKKEKVRPLFSRYYTKSNLICKEMTGGFFFRKVNAEVEEVDRLKKTLLGRIIYYCTCNMFNIEIKKSYENLCQYRSHLYISRRVVLLSYQGYKKITKRNNKIGCFCDSLIGIKKFCIKKLASNKQCKKNGVN